MVFKSHGEAMQRTDGLWERVEVLSAGESLCKVRLGDGGSELMSDGCTVANQPLLYSYSILYTRKLNTYRLMYALSKSVAFHSRDWSF